MTMLSVMEDHLIFPAPSCSYSKLSYRRHLCWVPWNKEIWVPPELKTNKDLAAQAGIPCMWFPAPKAAMVMFFMHGNAEDLGMSFSFIRHMRDQFKVNVFAVEYPGYGLLSELSGGEESLNAVVLTAFRFLVDQIGVPYESMLLLGRSIGTGPSCLLASKYPVGGLILVCAFVSIKKAIQDIAGKFVASMFDDKFRNFAVIQNVTCPTLLIHGEHDSMIPVEHSIELFRKCRARKLLVTPPKMEHNSNLFGDASYLAVPAINFFGLPGYCTTSPPRIPSTFFVHPQSRFEPRDTDRIEAPPWFWWCGFWDPKLGSHSKSKTYSPHSETLPEEEDPIPQYSTRMADPTTSMDTLSDLSTTLSEGS